MLVLRALVITFLYSVLYLFRYSIYHEIGHAFLIRIFDKNSNIIISRRSLIYKKNIPRKDIFWSIFLKRLLNVECVTKGVLSKQYGVCVVKEDFHQFTAGQLKIIAAGGYIAQTLYGYFLAVIFTVVFNNKNFLILSLLSVISIILDIMFTSYYGNEWIDIKIIRHTEQYLRYIKSTQENAVSTYEYQKNAIEKSIKPC